jgi:hypothetical protein
LQSPRATRQQIRLIRLPARGAVTHLQVPARFRTTVL